MTTRPPDVDAAFDRAWYLARYPDVAAAGMDPLEHYLVFGHLEHRNPTPYFETDWYRDTYLRTAPTNGGSPSAECPLLHYLSVGHRAGCRPHPCVDPDFVAARHALERADVLPALVRGTPVIDAVSEWFVQSTYGIAHGDVMAAGANAVEHFVHHGLPEGRRPHPGYVAVDEARAVSWTRPGRAEVARFTWKGRSLVVLPTSVPASVVEQVMAQGAFDTRIFAPGHRAIVHLPQTSAPDIATREGFDHRHVLDAVGGQADAVIVHHGLCLGGSEVYLARLARALDRDLGLRPVVLTTDADPEQDRAALQIDRLRGLRATQLVSLGPDLRRARGPVTSLALLLLAMAPRHLFVINSRFGYDALRRHGRALASVARVYVPFFSESPFAEGAPYSTLYLFDVIEHARVFADNQAVLDLLSARLGHQHRDRFVLLPQSVDLPSRTAFERALTEHLAARGRHRPRVLWMSRWCPFKATDALIALARRWPDLRIDVYGVPEAVTDFPTLPGLHRHGVVDPASLPLERYDAFVFTSRFEGMPNVVLEMAAMGVPLVCSDVGGLREVFDDDCVDFVPAAECADQMAAGFEAAIHTVLARDAGELSGRLRAARRAVEERCAPARFAARLATMLDVEQSTPQTARVRS